jgi:protein-L-isoaspartate(D-aspartate) O-methyltransferase
VTVEEHRRFYAEEIGAVAGLRTPGLIDAFAKVSREHFLGPGPWKLGSPDFGAHSGLTYRPTADADPRHLYHNVLVSIDLERQLNNGHPSTLASWIDAVEISPGAHVFHLGCGLGYYTALMAEVVGANGRVTAVEVDPGLAARARDNLAPWNNVEVISGDGGELDPGAVDIIFINAGVTHPHSLWLDRLRPGGRLLFPLTFDTGGGVGKGCMVLVKRAGDVYAAAIVNFVMIFSCTSLRDAGLNSAILQAVSGGKMSTVQSLRRDLHEAAETCWLHSTSFCLSTLPPTS